MALRDCIFFEQGETRARQDLGEREVEKGGSQRVLPKVGIDVYPTRPTPEQSSGQLSLGRLSGDSAEHIMMGLSEAKML